MKREKIKKIQAEEILDSRGRPTLLVRVFSEKLSAEFSVPAGASKGEFEAKELRDGGQRFAGFGVQKAKNNIEKIIAPKIKGFNIFDQEKIDKTLIELDGSEDKSNLGANAILGVSVASLKLAAKINKTPLWLYIAKKYKKKPKIPFLAMNFINGGKHSNSPLKIQEYLIILKGGRIINLLDEAHKVFSGLKKIVQKEVFPAFGVGDEGGLVIPEKDEIKALKLLKKATSFAFKKERIRLGLDLAANSFFEKGKYRLNIATFSREEMIKFVFKITDQFKIFYLEDPFFEEDFEAFAKLKELIVKNKKDTLLIGDDLTATNPERLKKAITQKAINAVLIKPNQIGTASETLETINIAQKHNLKTIVSHRSGETNDSFIADLAVGVGADGLKAGSIVRGERVAKYNRLLEIDKELALFKNKL